MRRLPVIAALLALSVPPASAHAAAGASWTALADCAAAYQANARLADPDRPASMTAQISETADDYAKAAKRAYRQQARRRSAAALNARIAAKASAFAARPRGEVERFIDACPQIGD